MKTRIDIACTLLLLLYAPFHKVAAQVFPAWQTSGNTAANSGLGKIGTTTGGGPVLTFHTNGMERMRINNDANGFVGINTLAPPAERLHVHNGALFVSGMNHLGGPMLVLGNHNGTDYTHGWGVEWDPVANGLNFFKPSATVNGGNYYLFLRDNGNVGIHTSTPGAMFHIRDDNQRFGGIVETTFPSTVTNIAWKALCQGSTARNTAVEATCTAFTNGSNISIYGYAHNARSSNVGARLDARSGAGAYTVNSGAECSALNGFYNTGVTATAAGTGTTFNRGMTGFATGQGAYSNIGVYGEAGNGTLNYGVYGVADSSNVNSWAAYFQGRACVTNYFQASDGNLKTDRKPITNATEILSRLQPATYRFRNKEFPGMNLPQGTQYGLIAQEVEQVLPEAVAQAHQPEMRDSALKVIAPELEYKVINYDAFIPILIQGMKEQQATITALQHQLQDLKAQVERSQEAAPKPLQGNSSLGQSIPNPTSGTTTIPYHLAKAGSETYLRLLDMTGKEVFRQPIHQPGNGTITLQADLLPTGTYLYELVQEGQAIACKRMVVNQ